MQRISVFFAFVFVAISLAFSPTARAQAVSSEVTTGNAVSQFFSAKAGIAPGETILVGFHQKLRDGWHVYWVNPGESGLPLDLRWTTPAGFSTSDPLYPLPHRLPLETLVNYGHEGEPTFLVELTAPPEAVPGTNADFSIKATWLICADICIPESGDFTLSIPVVAEPAGPDPQGFPVIENAKLDQPVEADFEAGFFDFNGRPVLHLDTDQFDDSSDIHYFPFVVDMVDASGPEDVAATGNGLSIVFDAGFMYDPAETKSLDGVLTVGKGRAIRGYTISAPQRDTPEDAAQRLGSLSPASTDQAADHASDQVGIPANNASSAPEAGLIGILWLAFLGGIILNIMPCVFPVVFLKAAHLAKAAHEERATIRLQGLLYTAGVLVTFLILAGILIALRAGGEQVGWGFHLQSPLVISAFAVVIFLVGLNLAGLFEIGTSLQGVGSNLAGKGGNAGAFFTGLLAVAVAAPCIGPFLGVPVGFALVQPAAVGLAVFAVMGLGLALPYLLISLVPGLARLLPKPGAWMETFKQVLSFAMFATLIWLIWTLTLQAGPDGLVLLLIALLLVAFAAWAFGRSQKPSGGWVSRGLAIMALIGSAFVISGIEPQKQTALSASSAPGEGDVSELPTAIFSPATLNDYRTAGTPVFIDFTAAWCVTCQFNKQRVLTQKPVVEAFHEKGVIYMVADWTLQDPEITQALEEQGRSGVPLYLFYAPGADQPVVLPQMLSIKLMLETFASL
ncbi:protein-disulfide reductase DsbD [Parvularcula sp. IMCC14364]|uniref:protein-disulfide reductase DsbD family protein n=1 Tax=Parvularcula sp. IMCC14364 TaxID=3067902 RepID=UPI0027407A18|nr:protein-disulfide reductase DsbD domain-containing protein [Parvularcula sp. IMCC14364]